MSEEGDNAMGITNRVLKTGEEQESQTIEWKWAWQEDYLKWLCGYANTDGGVLNIGVNDDGYVVGIENSKKMLEALPNKINDKLGIIAGIQVHSVYGAENICYGENIPEDVKNKLINQYATGAVRIDNISVDDKRYRSLVKIADENKIWEDANGYREYISIEIIKYPFAISCDGKYYKRSGSTLHELNGFELQNFLLERAGKTWDAVPIPGVSVGDLSKMALEEFRRKAVKSGRMSEAEVDIEDETLLRNLKLFDGKFLTRAAVLLFHPEPETFATGAYIKIGYFAKVGAFGADSEIIEDLQYQDVIDGPLILQVDKSIDLIFSKYFKGLVYYEGVQRTETHMLTKGIVRELLLNAINHKDYATGVPIQVSVYEDKIVIFNMGEWSKRVPTDISVYEKHESVPHNPKIADVFFRSGDVESWGRGFLKIKAECKQINAELPIIDASGGGVSVTAFGCEKYLKLLRYGQYGQVGADGVWRSKEAGSGADKGDTIEYSDVKIPMDVELFAKFKEHLREPRSRAELQEFCNIGSRDYFRKKILKPLIDSKKITLTKPDKPTSSDQRYVWNDN
jgi:ATP-dependent DNA helicase RecG